MIINIMHFLNKLENKIRKKLSYHPIVYAFIVGIGVILFWRGIWHTADDAGLSSTASVILGFIILVLTGVFVSSFIGNRLIISGLVGEKKLSEKEEEEIETEEIQLRNLQNTLSKLEKKLDHIDTHLEAETETETKTEKKYL